MLHAWNMWALVKRFSFSFKVSMLVLNSLSWHMPEIKSWSTPGSFLYLKTKSLQSRQAGEITQVGVSWSFQGPQEPEVAFQCFPWVPGIPGLWPGNKINIRKIHFHISAIFSLGGTPSIRALSIREYPSMGPVARQEQSYLSCLCYLAIGS